MPFVLPSDPASGAIAPVTWGDAVRDALSYLANPPSVAVRRDAVQSCANAASTTISWDVEEHDTDSMWTVGTPTRITFTTAGVYVVTASVLMASNATGYRDFSLLLSGSQVIGSQTTPAVSGSGMGLSVARTIKVAAAAYVEARMWQTSGAALNVSAGGGHRWTYMTAHWLGTG